MNKYTHQKLCFCQQPICTVICRYSPVGSNGYPLCDSKHLPMFLFTQFFIHMHKSAASCLSVKSNFSAILKQDMKSYCHT